MPGKMNAERLISIDIDFYPYKCDSIVVLRGEIEKKGGFFFPPYTQLMVKDGVLKSWLPCNIS